MLFLTSCRVQDLRGKDGVRGVGLTGVWAPAYAGMTGERVSQSNPEEGAGTKNPLGCLKRPRGFWLWLLYVNWVESGSETSWKGASQQATLGRRRRFEVIVWTLLGK